MSKTLAVEIKDNNDGKVYRFSIIGDAARYLGVSYRKMGLLLKEPETNLYKDRYQVRPLTLMYIPFPAPRVKEGDIDVPYTYEVYDAFSGELKGEYSKSDAMMVMGIGKPLLTTMLSGRPGEYVSMSGYYIRPRAYTGHILPIKDVYSRMMRLYPKFRPIVAINTLPPRQKRVFRSVLDVSTRLGLTTYKVKKAIDSKIVLNNYRFIMYEEYIKTRAPIRDRCW